MKKILSVLLCGALFWAVGCLPSSSSQPDLSEYLAEVECRHDCVRFGRGVYMNGGYVFTAAHIFPDSYQVGDLCYTRRGNDRTYESTVLFVDRTNDVAVLSSPMKNGATISGDTDVNAVFIVKGDQAEKCAARRRLTADGRSLLEVDGEFQKGMSGAPVFDRSGAVIGIIVSGSTDGSHAYAVLKDRLPTLSFSPLPEG